MQKTSLKLDQKWINYDFLKLGDEMKYLFNNLNQLSGAQWQIRNYGKPGAKRPVSLKAVALRDWLMHAVNKNLKLKRRNMDQNASWSCSWTCSSVHHFQKIHMNKFARKLSCHIWLEPAFNIDYKYHHEFVQKSTHKKIRSRIALTYKL